MDEVIPDGIGSSDSDDVEIPCHVASEYYIWHCTAYTISHNL